MRELKIKKNIEETIDSYVESAWIVLEDFKKGNTAVPKFN